MDYSNYQRTLAAIYTASNQGANPVTLAHLKPLLEPHTASKYLSYNYRRAIKRLCDDGYITKSGGKADYKLCLSDHGAAIGKGLAHLISFNKGDMSNE